MRSVLSLLCCLIYMSPTPTVWALENDGYILEVYDQYVRANHILQCTLHAQRTAPIGIEWPLHISVDLIIDNMVVHQQTVRINNWIALQKGFEFTLNTPKNITSDHVSLLILLRDRQNTTIRRLQKNIASVQSLRNKLLHFMPQIQAAQDSRPLARLRAEQLALLLRGTLNAYEIQQAAQFIHDIQQAFAPLHTPTAQIKKNQQTTQIIDGVYRSPVDNSWQPYRLYLPPQPKKNIEKKTPVIISCYDYGKTSDKARWPQLPELWIAQAAHHGYALLQIYPAGDLAWNGVTPYRVWPCVDQSLQDHPQLDRTQLFICTSGEASWTAIRAAQLQPTRLRGLMLFQASWPQGTPWTDANDLRPCATLPCALHGKVTQLLRDWTSIRSPQQRGLLSTAGLSDLSMNDSWRWITSRMPHSIDQPPQNKWHNTSWSLGAQKTHIILGNGEHLAAHQRNKSLLRTLSQSWVDHAHSNLHYSLDTQSKLTTITGDLVCVGNTRGNSILSEIMRQYNPLKITWDERFIHYPGGKTRLSDIAAVQLYWQRADGSHIIVIDGAEYLTNSAHSTNPTNPIDPKNKQTQLPLNNINSSWIRSQSGKILWEKPAQP